jgi:hypothetical protein
MNRYGWPGLLVGFVVFLLVLFYVIIPLLNHHH